MRSSGSWPARALGSGSRAAGRRLSASLVMDLPRRPSPSCCSGSRSSAPRGSAAWPRPPSADDLGPAPWPTATSPRGGRGTARLHGARREGRGPRAGRRAGMGVRSAPDARRAAARIAHLIVLRHAFSTAAFSRHAAPWLGDLIERVDAAGGTALAADRSHGTGHMRCSRRGRRRHARDPPRDRRGDRDRRCRPPRPVAPANASEPRADPRRRERAGTDGRDANRRGSGASRVARIGVDPARSRRCASRRPTAGRTCCSDGPAARSSDDRSWRRSWTRASRRWHGPRSTPRSATAELRPAGPDGSALIVRARRVADSMACGWSSTTSRSCAGCSASGPNSSITSRTSCARR